MADRYVSTRIAKLNGLVIVLLLALGAQVRLQAATSYTFTNTSGDGKWETVTNWNPNGVPGSAAGDSATIALASTSPTLNATPANALASFSISNNATLQIASGVTLTCGSCSLDTATITSSGSLVVTGTTTTNNASAITCTTTFGPTLTITTGTLKVAFSGTATFSQPTTINGNLQIGDPATGLTTVTVNAAVTINGTLTTIGQAANTITGTGSIAVNGAFNVNNGLNLNIPTFSTSATTTTTITPGNPPNFVPGSGNTTTFNGPVNLNNGTLTLGAANTVVNFNNAVTMTSSTIAGNSSAMVNIASGVTLTSDKTLGLANTVAPMLNNQGVITVNSGKFEIDGGGTSTGTINGTGGSFVMNSNLGAPFILSGAAALSGAIEIDAGPFTINVPLTYTGSMLLNGQNGNLAGTGSLTVNGPFTVQSGGGGSASTLPTITIPAGQTLTLPANGVFSLNTPSSNLVCNGSMTMAANSRLTINTGCTATFAGSISINQISGIAGSGNFVLTSTASLTSNASATIGNNNVSCNTINSGTITSQSGTVDFGIFGGTYTQNGGSLVLGGGNVNGTLALNGGTLTGGNTVTGTINNAATVAPGTSSTTATVTVTGNYSQTSAGVLNVKIGSATQFDSLAISGSATLGGTLNVSMLNSFTPAPGARFDILTYGSTSGKFATINAPGFTLDNSVSGRSTLVATPLPVPTISTLAPSSAAPGGAAFTLVVTGSNFVNGGSTVQWNGSARPTVFISSSVLTASIPASDIAAAGSAPVTVVNASPGGGTSAPLSFLISTSGGSGNGGNGGGGGGVGGGTIGTPQPPFLASGPYATPNVGVVGQPITLIAVAGDLDGDQLVYSWNFGDSTTGNGPVLTHTYTAAGVYTATVTVSDGTSTATGTVDVAVNAASSSATLAIQKTALKFTFSGSNKDSLQFAGTISGPSTAKTVSLQIGSFKQTFSSTDKNSKFALKSGKFALSIKNASLFLALKSAGFPTGAVNKPGILVPVDVILTLDGVSVSTTVTVFYTASTASGSAK